MEALYFLLTHNLICYIMYLKQNNILTEVDVIKMENIILISHGLLASGMKSSVEMILGPQKILHVVSMDEGSDNIKFRNDLEEKVSKLSGSILIIADLLGGTPSNVAFKLYSETDRIEIMAGMNLSLIIEALVSNPLSISDLINNSRMGIVDIKKINSTPTKKSQKNIVTDDSFEQYREKANIINTRIDERLIHGQVAGIWVTSLDIQRIIVINDEASSDDLQRSTLRMAAPQSIRLSILSIKDAAERINSGRYGNQRLFLLFKNVTDVFSFLNSGGHISSLNVGNISFKEGTREITKSIKVLPEEEETFRKIATSGVNITAQLVPSAPNINFIERLNLGE